MGSKTIFHSFTSENSLAQVQEATRKSLMLLGGTILEFGEGFQLKGGENGVNFAFTADIEATINVRETSPNKYDLFAAINWKPNGVFWACLIIGFFVFGILWIIPLLYLFIDPSQPYQQMLYRIQSILD